MSAIDDIIESLNKAAGEVMDEKEAVVEDLKADFKKDDEFINDTIKTRKACIIDKKERGSSNKKAAFKSETYSFEPEEKKEDKKEGYGYGYNGYGYGYGYGFSEKTKSDDEKKKESAKEKAKAIFKESARRASNTKSEDLFARHSAAISPNKKSKTKDSFKSGLITAILEACKTIIEIMEE